MTHLDLADESRYFETDTNCSVGDGTTPIQIQEHRLIHVLLEMRHESGQRGKVLLLIEDLWNAVAVNDAEVPSGARVAPGAYQLGEMYPLRP